jgi:hypothetical protein
MAEAVSPAPAEHSSVVLMDSAVDGTAPDAAATAAAAVLANSIQSSCSAAIENKILQVCMYHWFK